MWEFGTRRFFSLPRLKHRKVNGLPIVVFVLISAKYINSLYYRRLQYKCTLYIIYFNLKIGRDVRTDIVFVYLLCLVFIVFIFFMV